MATRSKYRAPKTDRYSMRCGDERIDYVIQRSPRRKKTIEFQLGGDGTLRVLVPATTPDPYVQRLIHQRAPLLIKKLRAARRRASFRLTDGSPIPYRGVSLALRFVPTDAPTPSVEVTNGHLRVTEPTGLRPTDRDAAIGGAVRSWYSAQASRELPLLVAKWYPKIPGLPQSGPPAVLIRNQRARLGSCAADGTLRFNWRVIMLAPALADLVVVHELAHILVQNHSDDFWDVVGGVLPDVSERRKALRLATRDLPPWDML